MFTSSVGFSMDVHFCGNELKNFSFVGEAEACEMQDAQVVEVKDAQVEHACCHAPKKVEKVKEICNHKEQAKGVCCHNETFEMIASGEIETSKISLPQFQQMLIAVIVLVPNINIFEVVSEPINYAFYNPPPLVKDVSILHQVFRI